MRNDYSESLPKQNQLGLRKLIKSLSKVSQIQTKQIRIDIENAEKVKNKKRIKYHVQSDTLLRQDRFVPLPNLLFTHKLYIDKNKKIESFNEKNIESRAYLKRANFQFRKIQQKKESIARKQYRSEQRYLSTPQLDKQRNSIIEQRKLKISEIFAKEITKISGPQIDKTLLTRLKTTVNSSRKQLKRLYQSHCKTMKSGGNKPNRVIQSIQIKLKNKVDSMKTEELNLPDENLISGTKSVALINRELKNKTNKKNSLDDLIKVSTARSKNKEQRQTEHTRKEQIDILANEQNISQMQIDIQTNNKLKQSIVFAHLKKLLYGDRKGRFIQDNTFRTRLKGQCSSEYMNVVKQQQNILQNFNGGFLNRRNLMEKFSDILGTLKKSDKQNSPSIEIQQFSLS